MHVEYFMHTTSGTSAEKIFTCHPKILVYLNFLWGKEIAGLAIFIDSYLFARLHDWLRFVIPPTILFL